MEVHGDLVRVQEHHGICRWFMALGHRRNRVQVEWHLMVEPPHGRIGNSAPAAAHRPVDMAEEQVAKVAAPDREPREGFGVRQADSIETRDANVKWRVMDEHGWRGVPENGKA